MIRVHFDALPHNGTPTSYQAAVQALPRAQRSRDRVMFGYRMLGVLGATDEEIEQLTGLSGNTVRPRRNELAAADMIVKAGYTRRTRSGRRAEVWIAAEFR